MIRRVRIIPYMAPELLRGVSVRSKEADIYAVGIIMSEIASGKLAFCERDHDVRFQLAICDGNRPEIPQGTPMCYSDVMQKCWNQDPPKRLTCESLLSVVEKWFSDFVLEINSEDIQQFLDADLLPKNDAPQPEIHSNASYIPKFIESIENFEDYDEEDYFDYGK